MTEQEGVIEEAPPAKRLSGAQQRKDERKRVLKDGVWCLPRAEQGDRVQCGKIKRAGH